VQSFLDIGAERLHRVSSDLINFVRRPKEERAEA
jgi:hypothetical protein